MDICSVSIKSVMSRSKTSRFFRELKSDSSWIFCDSSSFNPFWIVWVLDSTLSRNKLVFLIIWFLSNSSTFFFSGIFGLINPSINCNGLTFSFFTLSQKSVILVIRNRREANLAVCGPVCDGLNIPLHSISFLTRSDIS